MSDDIDRNDGNLSSMTMSSGSLFVNKVSPRNNFFLFQTSQNSCADREKNTTKQPHDIISETLASTIERRYAIRLDPSDPHVLGKVEAALESIRKDIRKELKLKEGAENLRRASSDRKALSQVQLVVKTSMQNLDALQRALKDLYAVHIVVSGSLSTSHSSGTCDSLLRQFQ